MNIFKKLSILCGLIAISGMASLAFAQDTAAPAEATAAPAPTPVAPVYNNFDDDWKISVNGKAKGPGTIKFKVVFAPSDDGLPGAEKFVEAPIPKGTRENDVAVMISNAFKAILGEDDFKIKVSWGENIKVKAKGDTPDFVLEVASNSVKGVSLKVKD
jgi:hypothetical protein